MRLENSLCLPLSASSTRCCMSPKMLLTAVRVNFLTSVVFKIMLLTSLLIPCDSLDYL